MWQNCFAPLFKLKKLCILVQGEYSKTLWEFDGDTIINLLRTDSYPMNK